MDKDRYHCSGCGRDDLPREAFHEMRSSDRRRDTTSHCKECRSERRYERLYPNSICKACLRHRHLDSNGACERCNADHGLRQCRGCTEVLPVLMSFYGRSKICKDCRKRRAPTPFSQSLSKKDARRDAAYRAKYGISLVDYDAMLSDQDGRCAICGEEPGAKPLAVDHDHQTNEIRGLLCQDCNVGLGHFRDRIEVLQAALAYLRSRTGENER